MPYMVSTERKNRARNSPVQVVPLHPLAEEAARSINPDRDYWKILSPTSILILNHPLPKRKPRETQKSTPDATAHHQRRRPARR